MNTSAYLPLLGLCLALAACGTRNTGFDTDAGSGDSAAGCASNADCDDRTACTTDRCLVGGVCEHTANNTMCATGQSCVSGRGCVAAMTMSCNSNADCDDMISCTADRCLVDHTCQHSAMDSLCPTGQTCGARGCGTSTGRCSTAADCDDSISCTNDLCGADGTCSHLPQNNLCPGGQTCNAGMGCIRVTNCTSNAQCDDHMYCNGVETCSSELACVSGTPVSCDDGDPCTRDTCDNSTMGCTHTMEPSCMGMMIRSGIYDLAMPIRYTCNIGSMPVLMLNATTLQVTVSGSAMTVNGAPTVLMGAAPSPLIGGRFDVSGTVAGDCNENYRLQGSFTDSTHFSGVMTVNFTGLTCGFTTCTSQTFPVSGTAR